MRSLASPIVARASAVVAVAIALAACAGPSPSAPGAQQTSAAGTARPAASVPASGGSSTSTPGGPADGASGNACDLLTDADVLELTGYAVATKGPTQLAYSSTCLWTLQGVAWDVSLGIDPTGGVSAYDRLVEYNGGGEELFGLGDRAIRLELTNNPIAQLGNALYDLQFTGFGEPEGIDILLLGRVLKHAEGR